MQIIMIFLEIVRRFGQKLGPYLVLEVLLPGGTLVALLLFLYRRRKLTPCRNTDAAAVEGGLHAGRAR